MCDAEICGGPFEELHLLEVAADQEYVFREWSGHRSLCCEEQRDMDEGKRKTPLRGRVACSFFIILLHSRPGPPPFLLCVLNLPGSEWLRMKRRIWGGGGRGVETLFFFGNEI